VQLADAGVSEERLLAAVEEDRLAVLPAELVLGGDAPYTLTDVAREAGLESSYLRRLWLAFGRPNPRHGERAFTDADLEEALIFRALLDAGLPRDGVVQVARTLGHSMMTSALAVRELVATSFLNSGDSEYELATRYQRAAEELGPLVAPLLGHELLVHIREIIRREAVSQAERKSGTIEGTRSVTVGFGDLVNFTKLGGELPAEELGHIAGRLAEIAARCATGPVHLVKTIGDAVMLVSEETEPLLDALLALLAAVKREGADFPALRAGAAHGRAVSRGGDWFGAPVNLASRLTGVAKPGTLNVDSVAQQLTAERYQWSRAKRKTLRGVGRARYFRLTPADS
jgi:adenylate cyclase